MLGLIKIGSDEFGPIRFHQGVTVSNTFRWRTGAAILALGLAASAPAFAHHSFSMFDNEHETKVVGVVSEFEWTNPHIYIHMQVDDGKGGSKPYTIEGASPGILNRIGWKFNLIKPGDKLLMVIAPLRNGEPGGLLKEVRLTSGQIMNNGGYAGPAAIHLGPNEKP